MGVDTIKQEVLAAGFELALESDLLANPKDDRTKMVFAPARAAPPIRRSSSSASRRSSRRPRRMRAGRVNEPRGAARRGALVMFAGVTLAGAALAAAALVPGAAVAHHSFFGRFDTQTVTELEGEVTEMLWQNPHAAMTIRARAADGTATMWEIETSSLIVLKRMGIEPGTIKVGDRVKLAGNPGVGSKHEMYARHVLLPDGRELLLNVGLKPRWAEHAVGDEALLMAREGDPSRPDLGLFRVWSHTRAIPRLLRETTDAAFDIQSYPMTPAARARSRSSIVRRRIPRQIACRKGCRRSWRRRTRSNSRGRPMATCFSRSRNTTSSGRSTCTRPRRPWERSRRRSAIQSGAGKAECW